MRSWSKFVPLGVAAALLLTVTVSVEGAGAASAAKTPNVHRVDLTAHRTAYVGKEKAERIHVMKAPGKLGRSSIPSSTAACAEPLCPMTYQGGSVQHNPKVYLLLWGPSWSASGADTLYLQHFLAGLGAQPQDTWSTSMTQYSDSTGRPTFSGSVLQGVWQDTSAVPYGVTQGQLSAEADAFYAAQGLTDNINSQIVVATPPGTCPENYTYSPACPGNSGYYCAWHSATSGNSVPYTNLPYLADGGPCGEGLVNSPGTYDGFSIVEGHEFAETVTDPLPYSGWVDLSDTISGGENGDKCAWVNVANVPFSTGSFPMQPLWSNSANSCVISTSAGLPDLVVSNLTWTPSSVGTSTAVSFSATITNQGSAASPAGVKHGVAFLVDGTEVNWSDNDTASLPAGSSITLTANGGPTGAATWSATAGTHTVQAYVDDSKLISESNETNNTLSRSLTVASTTAPDLVVTALTWSPASPAPGNGVQFTATIKNQGTAPTPAGIVHGVAFLVDGTNVAFADRDTASLAAGASITLTATGSNAGPTTWPATRGKHTVKAWVDDQNRITESNESNNTLSKALNVYASVAPSSVAISTGTLRTGTVTALAKADSSYYQVNSNTAATRAADWSATTAANIPNSTAGLQITYRGLNSRSCTETIYLYNYRTVAWVSLKTITVGTSAVTTVIVPSGTAADYVSGTSGNGTVKVRIKNTSTAGSFYTSGDQVAIGYL